LEEVEDFMGVAAISVAVAMGGAVAVTAGTAVMDGVVGIGEAGTGAAGTAGPIGMVAADTGMVVLPIGGIIHTLVGLMVGK
jgi:hypothetical protein